VYSATLTGEPLGLSSSGMTSRISERMVPSALPDGL